MARLLLCRSVGQRRFNGFAAAGVEVENLRDLVFGPRRGGGTEAGGRRGFITEVGVCSEELEEIESDVFRAASGGDVTRFHGCLSEQVANGDGSGLRERDATWFRSPHRRAVAIKHATGQSKLEIINNR